LFKNLQTNKKAYESVNEGKYDGMLDVIEDLVGKAKSFMDVGNQLKKHKVKYSFSTSMIPMYKLDKLPIAIVNKKYVDKADREVGDIAIGLMESIKESLNEVNPSLNKKVKKYLDAYLKGTKKNSPEHQHAIMLIMKGALTDANFHSEARQLDKFFPKAKQSKHVGTQMEDVIEDKGVDIAKWAKWDGYDIIDAFSFYTNMVLGGGFGKKLETLKESINEAKLSTIHKAAKKGSYPVSLVVIKDGKVIKQVLNIKTPQAVPAVFNVVKNYHKHKDATVHIEDSTGKRLFSEATFRPNSGTMSGGTYGLDKRKYELKRDVKGVQIGDYTNVTLPKGTIIYNLPGGVFAHHRSLKSYEGGQNKYFNKSTFRGISIRREKNVILSIEKNSKILESVNEGKTISYSKISMMGARVLNKISIGTIFDTEDGKYEITDYGRQANAFKEFEAEHNGKKVKVKLTAMYGVELEVTDDVRSSRFNKKVKLNSIILESINEVGVNVWYFYKKANKNKNKFFKMLSDFRKKHSDTEWIKMLNYALEDFNENPKKYKTIDDKQNILFKNLQNNKKVYEGMMSTIDQIRQDSKDVRDFVKNVFKDREFKKMSNDKDFIKYLKSIYEGVDESAKVKSLEEKINLFVEKNVPTNPSKWSYYKSQAKKKFDVYPSAYANGWAAKKYKAAGGGWKKEK
jgi:hypothetical protein